MLVKIMEGVVVRADIVLEMQSSKENVKIYTKDHTHFVSPNPGESVRECMDRLTRMLNYAMLPPEMQVEVSSAFQYTHPQHP